MSDQAEHVDFQFEEPKGEDLEFEFLPEGQKAPEEPKPEPAPAGVTLTEEQYKAILAGRDPSAAITTGLSQLVEKMQAQQPANQAVAPIVDDWNPEKLESELFAAGKSVQTVEKIVQRALGAAQNQVAGQLQAQNKRLLKVDPKTSEYYAKYEGEIEKRVAALPPQYRGLPNLYEQVYQQVILEKQDEIVADKVQKSTQAAIEQAVKAALEAAGVKTPGIKPAATLQNEVGNAISTPKPAAAGPKKVYLTAQDRQSMSESLMDPNDAGSVRAYLKSKGRL